MARLSRLLGSTVGKKYAVGLTGVGLIGFIIFHLLGNLSLFKGQEAFNDYAHTLEGLPGAMLGEVGIAVLFLLHIGLTLSLARDNAAARPQAYEQNRSPTRFASAWMVVSGGIILLFLVVHLYNLRFGPRWDGAQGLYGLTRDTLANPAFGVLYIAGVALLFFHLSHGVQAVFRTLGYTNPDHLEKIGAVAKAVALIVAVGFISMPVAGMLGLLK